MKHITRRFLFSLLPAGFLSAQTRTRVDQIGAAAVPAGKVMVIPPNSYWAVLANIGDNLVLEQVSGTWTLRALSSATPATERRDDWVAASAQTAFTLSLASTGEPDVYRNGLLQRPGADYSYDPPTRKVTFSAPLTSGDYVTARYRG